MAKEVGKTEWAKPQTPQVLAAEVRWTLDLLGNHLTAHPRLVRGDWERLLDLWLEASKVLRKLEGEINQLPLEFVATKIEVLK